MTLKVHERVANPGRVAPAIFLALKVAIEEALEVVEISVLVIVRPLHRIVDAEPLVLGFNPAPAAEGAGRMDGVGIACDDVGRDPDLGKVRYFGLPEIVEQGMTLGFGDQVLAPVLADEAAL